MSENLSLLLEKIRKKDNNVYITKKRGVFNEFMDNYKWPQ